MSGLLNLYVMSKIAETSINLYGSDSGRSYYHSTYKPPVVTTKTRPRNIPEHILYDILCYEKDSEHWHQDAEKYISGDYLKKGFNNKSDKVETIEDGVRVTYGDQYAREFIVKDGILTSICYLRNSKGELVKSSESTDGEGYKSYDLETGALKAQYFAPEIIQVDADNVRKIHRYMSFYPNGNIKDKIYFSTYNDSKETEDYKHIQYRKDKSVEFKQKNNKCTRYDEQDRIIEESTESIVSTYHDDSPHHSTELRDVSRYTYYPDTDQILSIRSIQVSREIKATAVEQEKEIDYQHFKKNGTNDSKKYKAMRAVAKKHIQSERTEAMKKLGRSRGVTHRKKNFLQKGAEYWLTRISKQK